MNLILLSYFTHDLLITSLNQKQIVIDYVSNLHLQFSHYEMKLYKTEVKLKILAKVYRARSVTLHKKLRRKSEMFKYELF